jgi:hypothetical protein
MSGLQSRYKTLGQLRTDLRIRLGFIAQGPAAANNQATLDSFLQEAHDYVYGELNPSPARHKSIIQLQPGEVAYDYHDDILDEDIDPGNIISVWVKISDTIRQELAQGITEYDRSMADFRSWPERYDTLAGQIELYPVPDQAYDLIIEHIRLQGRFEQDADRPSVPHRLVFQYALANAKAHYRHPDAQAAATTFTNMLAREKGKQHEGRRYIKPTGAAELCEPQVVLTAGGYRLRT